MKIIKYEDNDAINQPNTGSSAVWATESQRTRPVEKKDIIQQFPKVFAETTGQLAGEYHIQLASGCKPVQHVPRRVPLAIREKVRQKLDDFEAQ